MSQEPPSTNWSRVHGWNRNFRVNYPFRVRFLSPQMQTCYNCNGSSGLFVVFFHNKTHAGCFEDYLDTFLFQILLIRQEKNVKSVPVTLNPCLPPTT